MSYGLVGLYALYFVFVGVNGNASKMTSAIETDAKAFAPWLLSILVLKALSNSDTIRPLVNPFIALALVTYTVKNYGVIISQLDQITGLSLPGGTSAPSGVSSNSTATPSPLTGKTP